MNENQTAYRNILKATSIFGGVQVVKIIVAIIKSKVIAVLLGPVGIGFTELLTSTITLINSFAGFGIDTSAVKSVAEANASQDEKRVSTISWVLKRTVWITGIFGALVMIGLSPYLSQLAFGTNKYTIHFIWISLSMLLTQLSAGQMVLMQGMQKVKLLAQASLLGSSLGLLAIIPIYYYFKIDGIVPSILITAVINLLCTAYFSAKIRTVSVNVPKSVFMLESKRMIYMGFLISLSSLISIGGSYVLRIYITRYGSVDQLGLYAAGFAIINTYVGLIFTAMGTEYFPRLSSIAADDVECVKTINNQGEIAVLILAPIISVFIVFIHWGIIVLYSTKFVEVENMLQWAIIGIFFKAITWSIGFVFLAKGDSKIFLYNELFANLYILILNILGYKYFGLNGLGIAFLIGYIISLAQVYLISRARYSFYFNPLMKQVSLKLFFVLLLCFLNMHFVPKPYSYFTGMFFISFTVWYSFIELNKRVGLKAVLSSAMARFKN